MRRDWLSLDGISPTSLISQKEQSAEPVPLFCARFVRGSRPIRVVFRLKSLEEAEGYIKDNFGEQARNIQIEAVADPAPYADLSVGYIREININ